MLKGHMLMDDDEVEGVVMLEGCRFSHKSR